MKRTDYKEFAQRLELKAFIPPDSAVEIAQNRTEDLVTYFQRAVHGQGWLKADEMLHSLVRSAYLQGVTDVAQAMVITRKRRVKL